MVAATVTLDDLRRAATDLVLSCCDEMAKTTLIPLCVMDRIEGRDMKPEALEALIGGIVDACRSRTICLAGGETELDADWVPGTGRLSVIVIGSREGGGGSCAMSMDFTAPREVGDGHK